MPTTTKNRKHIRITLPAKRHLEQIVEILKAQGHSTSGTAYASDLILAQPVPPPNPQPGNLSAQERI